VRVVASTAKRNFSLETDGRARRIQEPMKRPAKTGIGSLLRGKKVETTGIEMEVEVG